MKKNNVMNMAVRAPKKNENQAVRMYYDPLDDKIFLMRKWDSEVFIDLGDDYKPFPIGLQRIEYIRDYMIYLDEWEEPAYLNFSDKGWRCTREEKSELSKIRNNSYLKYLERILN